MNDRPIRTKGPAAFAGDRYVHAEVARLIGKHGITRAFETGTRWGKTTEALACLVRDQVHTIEVVERVYDRAVRNLERFGNVLCHLGDSAAVLGDLLQGAAQGEESGALLFYLDAHWQERWPLLDELKAIGEWCLDYPVIVIHDCHVPGRDLGFDSYLVDGEPQALDFAFVQEALHEIYEGPNFSAHYNPALAGGKRRGVLFVEPNTET